jgi:hypothetical protein
VRKIMVRLAAVLAALLLSLGLTAGAAEAQPRDDTVIVIGPSTPCKIITFFDFVIFEYDCVYPA